MSTTQIHGVEDVQPNTIDNTVISPTAGITLGQLAKGADIILQDGSVAFTSDVDFGNKRLLNVADGVNPGDGATVSQVQTAVAGLKGKGSCWYASTVADGNITLSGLAETIDGKTPVAGQRVLLRHQTSGVENGIWVTAAGAWTRPTDFAAGSDAAASYSFIMDGDTQAEIGFYCTNDTGAAVVGSDALVFTEFYGPTAYNFTSGLTNTGTTVSIAAQGVTAAKIATAALGDAIGGGAGTALFLRKQKDLFTPGPGGNTVTLTLTPISDNYLHLSRDGLTMYLTDDYTRLNKVITMAKSHTANTRIVALYEHNGV